MADNIILIGFSGTGKTTVARRVAARLGWAMVDADEIIVQRFGKPVDRIFAEDGEAVFRAVEREITVAAAQRQRSVVSVGGGAVVDPQTRAAVAAGNLVVRLEASPETICARLSAESNTEIRPVVAGPNPIERIRTLQAARSEAYNVAAVTVNTDDRLPDDVAEEVLRALEHWNERRDHP